MTSASSAQWHPAAAFGVTVAGAEFGVDVDSFSNRRPGIVRQDYVFTSEPTIRYLAQAGVRMFRVPFRWERIQPQLGAALDQEHVHQLRRLCRAAERRQSRILLDLHNYGRYRIELNGLPHTCIVDERVNGTVPVSRNHLADLWRRLAQEFHDEPGLAGYGLMNEPHDMGASDWKQISQHCVNSIRSVDRQTWLFVAGDDWSSAERFVESNGPHAWIVDPTDRTVYEAHCYFDHDGSGKYALSFVEEARRDSNFVRRGANRVRPFLKWCNDNGVPGFIGEYGTPSDPPWREVTRRFLEACRDEHMPVCLWAAGEWWGDYPLSIQPRSDSLHALAPQLNWLLASMNLTFEPNESITH